MTFTFDPALPSPKDRLRFRLDDIDAADVLIQDETYLALVNMNGGNETMALRDAAQSLLQHFSQEPETAALGDGVSFNWGQRVASLTALIAQCNVIVGGVGASGTVSLFLAAEVEG